MKRIFALTLGLSVAVVLFAQNSGNPILPGWYADPEGVVYGDTFWIYPTTSRLSGDDVETYKADAERKQMHIARHIICRLTSMLSPQRIWYIGPSIVAF